LRICSSGMHWFCHSIVTNIANTKCIHLSPVTKTKNLQSEFLRQRNSQANLCVTSRPDSRVRASHLPAWQCPHTRPANTFTAPPNLKRILYVQR
jgi:hypothetical protein